ncbi:MAG: glycosyltransferase [Cyanobacteria bacterium J06623_7]
MGQSLIITGMHRSGTSLTASLLQSAGVNIGDRLMGKDTGNDKGHFEDLDFVQFHQQVLESQDINPAGWTEQRQIKVQRQYLATAKSILSARQDLPLWGWKDPRTTLFLDFWSSLIADARYVLLYRSPWDVVDSLFRRGDIFFRDRLDMTVSQWCNYNQAVLDFYREHQSQCLLLQIESVIYHPEAVISLINQKFELSLRSPDRIYEESLFKTNDNEHHQSLISKFFPEATEIYRQLQNIADHSSIETLRDQSVIKDESAALVLQDWYNFNRMLVAKRKIESEFSQPQKQLQIAQKKIENLDNIIRAMESSKFWQLRRQWFALKQKLHIKSSDRIYQDHFISTTSRMSQQDAESSDTYSANVYPSQASKNSLLKQIKQNFPQKAQIKKIIWRLKSWLPSAPAVGIQEPAQSKDPRYQKWLSQNYPHPGRLTRIAKCCQAKDYQPLISIIVPVYNPDAEFLRQAIESVLGQAYPRWELCLADDCSTKSYVWSILQEYAQKDSRIKVMQRSTNGHICHASNSALELASGEYIALLDHDDLLAPHALAEVVKLLSKHPEADFIYSDEDKVNTQNIHSDPYFKPDWCPDTFLSRMYTCHLGVYRHSLIKEVGGFRPGFEGSQDYDLVLRVTEKTDHIFHIPDVLYHWRIHSQSTAAFADAKTYAFDAGQKAIAEAIVRRGQPGRVISKLQFPGVYTVRYEIQEQKLVSIIIPTRDLAETLHTCLKSIFTKTTYSNYEVIVIDNGSQEAKTAECLVYWQQEQPDRLRCYRYDIPFNYSRINNYAVSKARGDYLLFLNNDTEVISSDWIEAMVEQVQRESIGAVGGLLLYPDDTIQHAGVVLGLFDVAGHGHRNFAADQPGYISQIVSTNNYSAVTAACLMCRRETFTEVGGFEERLQVAFNDVDFCLKLVSRGYRNIYLPHVVLYHYEYKSRGSEDSPKKQARFAQEIAYMKQTWQELCDRDPCYNPHLTRDYEDYRLDI